MTGPQSGRRVRLEDVARRCGVSISTVSRALRGGSGVRPDLREQVLRAARDCNYAVAPLIEGRRLLVIASAAAMVDLARSQFTLSVMQGLQERAAALRLDVITHGAGNSAEASALLRSARSMPDLAGVLLLTLDEEGLLAEVSASGLPAVVVNGDDPMMRLSSVAPCNRAAAALAMDHLMALGHRRVLFVMRRGRRTIERRLEGWRDRQSPGAAAPDTSLVVEVPDWLPEPAAEAVGRRIDEGGLDFTAVLAAGDSLAIGAARALVARGIAVPGQVSVMGMDGLPQAAFHVPPLSVIEMPMREIGAVAVDTLSEALRGSGQPPRRIELACRLVARASTAPPAQTPAAMA